MRKESNGAGQHAADMWFHNETLCATVSWITLVGMERTSCTSGVHVPMHADQTPVTSLQPSRGRDAQHNQPFGGSYTDTCSTTVKRRTFTESTVPGPCPYLAARAVIPTASAHPFFKKPGSEHWGIFRVTHDGPQQLQPQKYTLYRILP